MKFFMYSSCGEGAQILKRIELEGNEVGLYIDDKIYKHVFDGLIPKVGPDFADKDTIIIFDSSGHGDIADDFKRKGLHVYGSSSFADKLEKDRAYGYSAMQDVGIKIPDYKEFQTFAEGLEYVREANRKLVFKPSGSMPCKLTFVADNAVAMSAYMQFVEKRFGKHIKSFILQDFIEGVVVSSEFFCSEEGFIDSPNHTVEVKHSMNDELGPSTGCSGNITWSCELDSIIEEGVAKIESLCKENNYIGQIDLNTVVNDSNVYGLEWTPRFGYDATPTLFSIFEGDLGKFFSDISRGQLALVPISDLYAGGVRLTIPPYPVETDEDTEKISPNVGVPILDISEEECYFYEVKDEDGQFNHSGGTGVILCAVGSGETPDESLIRPYEILEEAMIPDKQYRTDLKEILPKAVREVESYA